MSIFSFITLVAAIVLFGTSYPTLTRADPLSLDIRVLGVPASSSAEFDIKYIVDDGSGNGFAQPRVCSHTSRNHASFSVSFKCEKGAIANNSKHLVILGSATSGADLTRRSFFPLRYVDLTSLPNYDNIRVELRAVSRLEVAFGASFPFVEFPDKRFLSESENVLPSLYSIRAFLEYANEVNVSISEEIWGRLTQFFQENTPALRELGREDRERIFTYLARYHRISRDPGMARFYFSVLARYSKNFPDTVIYAAPDATISEHAHEEISSMLSNRLSDVFNLTPQYLSFLEDRNDYYRCARNAATIMSRISADLHRQRQNILQIMNQANRCVNLIARGAGVKNGISGIARHTVGLSDQTGRLGLDMMNAYVALAESLADSGVIAIKSDSSKVKEIIKFYFEYDEVLESQGSINIVQSETETPQ
ncbi:MAG: hypothetical protein AAGF71_09130 [Pseudomonadota bacterium]